MIQRFYLLASIIICSVFAASQLGYAQTGPTLLQLTDGSHIPGVLKSLDSQEIGIVPAWSMDSATTNSLSIALSQIRLAILTRPVTKGEEESFLRQIEHNYFLNSSSAPQKPVQMDRIITNRGDVEYGYVEKLDWFSLVWNPAEGAGTVQNGDGTGSSVRFPLTKIRAVVFAPRITLLQETPASQPGSGQRSVWLHLSGHGRIRGLLNESDWNRLESLALTFPGRKRLPDEVRRELDSSETVSVYSAWSKQPVVLPISCIESVEAIPSSSFPDFYWLSSVPVTQYKYIPFGVLNRSYFVDQSPDGAQLRSRSGSVYRHGFYVFASSRLTFLLPDLLSGKKGSSDSLFLSGTLARPAGSIQGSVRFRAFYEGRPLGEWVLAASDAPLDILVSLPQSSGPEARRRLDLVVDFADDDAVDDEIILGNFRIGTGGGLP